MNRTDLFAFENDFVKTLRCIPMAVRFKLDLCGVKLSLRQWSRLTSDDRRALLMTPCGPPSEIEDYRQRLVDLVAQRTQEAAKSLPPGSTVDWADDQATPPAVAAYAASIAVEPPSDEQWARLDTLQRFVLLKLCRDNHDNVNFVPALLEFGLIPPRRAAESMAS